MVPHALLPRVIGGLVVLGVFGALTVIVGLQECRNSGPPLVASVAEASARVRSGETLEHLRLGDLSLLCDTLQLAQKRAYAGAVGVEGVDGPLVLVELDADGGCNDGPATLVGTLERPEGSLLAALSLADHPGHPDTPQVTLLRPHPDNFVTLLVLGVLSLLGGWLIVSGLKIGREQLRRLVEEPPADLGAEHPSGDPYRAAASGRCLLPGPLRLSDEWARGQRREGVGSLVLATVCLAGAAMWSASFARDALRDHAVWFSGVLATDVQVDGESRTRMLVLEDADMTVVYTDGAGLRHHGRVSRMGFGKLDTRRDPVVHLATDDPDRFAISWMVDGFVGALALHLVLVGMLGVFGVALLVHVRKSRRALAQVRDTLYSDPEEVVLEVFQTTHGEANGNRVTTTYCLHIPGGDTFDLTLPASEYPLFLEIDQSRVLGLRRVGDRGHAVVVREDMTPLAAPPGEAERVRLRWRAGKRPPGEPGIDAFIQDRFANRRRPRARPSGAIGRDDA